MELVQVVNEEGRTVGSLAKMEAHRGEGVLHRALSVMIVSADREILLQQRAHEKHHWAGYWSNTVCSHPRPEEPVGKAALRRLREELGIEGLVLREVGTTTYQYFDSSSGLSEREWDHVFVAECGEKTPAMRIDPQEVADTKWVTLGEARELQRAGLCTPWMVDVIDNIFRSGTNE